MQKPTPVALVALALAALPAAATAGPAPGVQPPKFPPSTLTRPRHVTPHGYGRDVILDVDSDTIQLGFAGDTAPRLVVPAVAGVRKSGGVTVGVPPGGGAPVAYGNDALAQKQVLRIVHPIQQGVVTDFGKFAGLVRYALGKLGVAPANSRILMNERPLEPKVVKTKLATLMLETLGFQAFYIAQETVLALYASGQTTGVVVDGAHDRVYITPIFEGYYYPHATTWVEISEPALLRRWSTLEGPRGVPANDEADQLRLDQAFGYIALDPKTEPRRSSTFRLSNGQTIRVGTERFMAPEAYFEPRLLGLKEDDLSRQVNNSIMRCKVDIRHALYDKIVIAGRVGHYRGLDARLRAGVQALAKTGMTVNVLQPSNAAHSIFIGESILASLPSFGPMYITRAEYEKAGAGIVFQKCN